MPLYTCAPIPSSLRFNSEGETVLYHEISGSTHLVNSLGRRILELLMQSPLTLQELSDRLNESEPVCLEAVKRFLDFAVEQGLITLQSEQAVELPPIAEKIR